MSNATETDGPDRGSTRRATGDEATGARANWETAVRSVPVRRLWLGTVLVAAGDLVTTVYGLSIGLSEGNPVVAPILAEHGAAGLVALKLLVLGVGAAVWVSVERLYGVAALVGLAAPQALAVVCNVLTLLSV